MRWVWPGSIASVSSQNGFQPSSSRSSSRKWWPCRWKTVAIVGAIGQRQHHGAAGFGAEGGLRLKLRRSAGVTQSAAGRRARDRCASAFLRSSRAGRPLDGSGGGGGSGAARTGGSLRDDQPADRAGLLAVVQEDR